MVLVHHLLGLVFTIYGLSSLLYCCLSGDKREKKEEEGDLMPVVYQIHGLISINFGICEFLPSRLENCFGVIFFLIFSP